MSEELPHYPPPDPDSANEVEKSPRAFVSSTGMVFQAAGGAMFVGACCLWGLSGLVVRPVRTQAGTWLGFLSGPQALTAMLTLAMVVTVVGGLALAAVGIGLHGERRESGRLGMAVAGALALSYLAAAFFMFTRDGLAWAVISCALGLTCGVLFLLAAHSAAVLKQFPPPPDQNRVTDEFIQRYRREREQRRKKYDL